MNDTDQARANLEQSVAAFKQDLAESDRAIEETLRLALNYFYRRRQLLLRYNNLIEQATPIARSESNGISSLQNLIIELLRDYGLDRHPGQLSNTALTLIYEIMDQAGTSPRVKQRRETMMA